MIPTIKALRDIFVAGRYGSQPTPTTLGTLSNSDAINLALGSPFYLDNRKPILEARSVDLERGAGHYYVKCITVRSKKDLTVVLVDHVSYRFLRKEFNGTTLAIFDILAPLW